jgi:hypothetical protein
MKELKQYRTNLLQRLEEAAKAFRAACLTVQDPYAPVEPGGWNIHQIAAHTRDGDSLVYGLRARRTALEENPEFVAFDGDVYMAEHYDPREPLDELLDEFVASVESLLELLRDLSPEGWSRLSRHTTLGRDLTLQSWVERDLAHIEEHLRTVASAS